MQAQAIQQRIQQYTFLAEGDNTDQYNWYYLTFTQADHPPIYLTLEVPVTFSTIEEVANQLSIGNDTGVWFHAVSQLGYKLDTFELMKNLTD